MAFIYIKGVEISSIVSCVPKNKLDNLADSNIPTAQAKKIVDTTGIRYRRISQGSTTSDLCLDAAEHIFKNTDSKKENVEFLIFVSQTPDYPLPATSIILQDKLSLSKGVMALDINLGCSGFVYGLSVITSLLEKSSNKNATALLMVGDVSSVKCNIKDLSTYPLFADAGTATLIKKQPGKNMQFDLHSDGAGYKAIIIPDGASRNPYSEQSEVLKSDDEINYRKDRELYLNGMDVFSFGITRVPKAIKAFYELIEKSDDDIDYYFFHQANLFMNEKIRKKLKISQEKVPYSLYDFGNVSSATIPITISSKLKGKLIQNTPVLSCGFGVGLSWGVSYFELSKNTYLNTIEK